MKPFRGWWLNLLVVGLAFLTCPAQDDTVWTPDSIPMGSQIGYAAAFPVVKGRPYTAHIVRQQVQRLPDGTSELHEAHNIHRRDAEGRLVDEKLASPRVKHGISETYTEHRLVIVDPVNMSSTQWGDKDKVVVVSSVPSSLLSIKPHPAKCLWEKLEPRTILGVEAEGCRSTATTAGNTVVTETWRSPLLEISLLVETRDSSGMQSRMEVTQLELGEPSESWFTAPRNFRRVGDVDAQ